VSANLPGRAVDIVHAAAAAAGIPLDRITVNYVAELSRPGWVRLLVATGQRTAHEAETLLRQLGVAEPTAEVTVDAGFRETRYEHECPAIGQVVVVLRVDEKIADPPPAAADLDEVIAQVDAARATADEDAHQALVAGLLGALADSQADIDADEQAGGGEDR
jgi:hypothetical protein